MQRTIAYLTAFAYTVRKGGDKREVSIPVSVTAHRTKNFRKEVIFWTELQDASDEISEGFSNFGVTETRRTTAKKGGSAIPTDSIILTNPTEPHRTPVDSDGGAYADARTHLYPQPDAPF